MALDWPFRYNKKLRLNRGWPMRHTNDSVLWSAISSSNFVPICFSVYILLRLAIIIFVPIDQFSDNLWYYTRAVTIASGQGYSEGGIATAFWPPGWPGFLGILFWLFGASAFVGQIANLVFAAVVFVLALSVGSTIFADKKVGRLTVLLLTFYPNQIGYI